MLNNNLIATGEILCKHERALTNLFLLVNTSTVNFGASSSDSDAPNFTYRLVWASTKTHATSAI